MISKKSIFGSLVVLLLLVGVFVSVNQVQKQQKLASKAAEGSVPNSTTSITSDADFNSNGKVDIFDFNSFITVFGQTVTPGTSANVRVLNVKAYGAKGDGVTDDTAAIQNVIDHMGNQGKSMYQQIYFPNGEYIVDGLNAGRKDGLVLKGETMNGVRLIPKQNSSKPVIDLTGSTGVVVENIGIWSMKNDGTAPDVIPSIGFLIAPTVAGQNSNKIHFYNVSALGFFTRSPYFIIGLTDSSFINTTSQSWIDGASALVLASKNNVNNQPVISAYAPFLDIIGVNGSSSVNDITFVQCEFHNLSRQTNGEAITRSSSPTTIL